MNTWRTDVSDAITKLGGIGEYNEIYAEVAARRPRLPPTWKAIVRQTIEQASSDSLVHRAGTEDLFYSVYGLGKGVWGLREPPDAKTVAEPAGDTEVASGQGYALDSVVRSVIERYAVGRAIDHYTAMGAEITEHGKPFDLLVELGDDQLHVEVKGSTRDLHSVTLTRNEVEDARSRGTNQLFVVDNISLLTASDGAVKASGGRQRIWGNWVPGKERLTPIVYHYRLTPP